MQSDTQDQQAVNTVSSEQVEALVARAVQVFSNLRVIYGGNIAMRELLFNPSTKEEGAHAWWYLASLTRLHATENDNEVFKLTGRLCDTGDLSWIDGLPTSEVAEILRVYGYARLKECLSLPEPF